MDSLESATLFISNPSTLIQQVLRYFTRSQIGYPKKTHQKLDLPPPFIFKNPRRSIDSDIFAADPLVFHPTLAPAPAAPPHWPAAPQGFPRSSRPCYGASGSRAPLLVVLGGQDGNVWRWQKAMDNVYDEI